ncbi:hypothetical protein L873DRAFT_1114856 [Choiromyces venosus 120613-1]|uniref:Uncharacterized protein n=1 Tax=Choiromyces venosus 120613-1 TaxID=1336337 RepID=A0A3N4JH83_9PEZI|nr:hypothetical protein L873DRAFT_1114856 [Choiromyces venosus 120613-1]
MIYKAGLSGRLCGRADWLAGSYKTGTIPYAGAEVKRLNSLLYLSYFRKCCIGYCSRYTFIFHFSFFLVVFVLVSIGLVTVVLLASYVHTILQSITINSSNKFLSYNSNYYRKLMLERLLSALTRSQLPYRTVVY